MANRSGQGSNIPQMARGGVVSAPLETPSFSRASGASDLAGTAAYSLAGALEDISRRMGQRLDIQAEVEGARAGAADGQSGIPGRKGDTTIRGAAYNQAAEDSVSVQYELRARQALSGFEEKNPVNPTGFANAADAWLEGVMPELQSYDPALAQRFSAEYQLRALSARERIHDAHLSVLRDRYQEEALTEMGATQNDIAANVEGLFGSDAERSAASMQGLSLSLAKIGDLAGRIGPDGRPLFTAGQRVGAVQDARRGMAQAAARKWAAQNAGPAAQDIWDKGEAAVIVRQDGAEKKILLKDIIGEADYNEASDLVRAEVGKIMAQRRAAADVVDKGVAQARKLMDQGYSPPQAVLDDLVAQADGIGDPATAERARQARDLFVFQSYARQWRPEDLQSWINGARADVAAGATPAAADKIEMAEKLLSSMKAELERDPLSWGARIGLTSGAPLNPVDPASVKQRIFDGKMLEARYGILPPLMTDEEAAQWKSAYDLAGAEDKAGMIDALVTGFGDDAPGAIAPLFKEAGAVANVAGLLTQGPAHHSTVRDFVAGDAAMAAGVRLVPAGLAASSPFTVTTGNAYGFAPEIGSAVKETADRIYTARAARRGKGPEDFDEDLYSRALQEAAGAWWDGQGRQHGGITAARGGHKYVLPPDMTEDDFEGLLRGLTPDDLVKGSVGGGPPVYQSGRTMTADDLRRFWLISTGPGIYGISMTNPAKGDPVMVGGSGQNGFYELDVNRLGARR